MMLAGVAKDLMSAVHLADGSQVSTGTIFAVIRLESSDADDGKFWDGDSWETTPAPFPTATHTQAGQWFYALIAAATSGKPGSTVHFTFTDDLDETVATTVSGGGEHYVRAPADFYDGAIHIDANNGAAGTVLGVNGTLSNPVIALADAITIAGGTNIHVLKIINGSVTLTGNLNEYHVVGFDEAEFNFGGFSVNGTTFENIVLKGTMTGTIDVTRGFLEDVTGFKGVAHDTGLGGTITLAAGESTLDHCHSREPGTGTPVIDFVAAGRSLNFRAYSGGIQLINMVNANNICSADFIAGNLIIAASCVAGTLVLRDGLSVENNSSGTSIVRTAHSPNLIWDALKNAHVKADSFGEQVQTPNFINGAAINSIASSYVLTTGTQSSGTFNDTSSNDGVEHVHTDVGGALDLYYEYGIGGDGIPSQAQFIGRVNGVNDSLDVFAWDWVAAAWDKIGTLSGKGGGLNDPFTFSMLRDHVGSGADLGKVRVRFFAAAGLTSATLSIDELIVSYVIASRVLGYENGAIWIDTAAGNINTEVGVDGVAGNPVSTLAAALTLNSSLGLNKYHLASGSSVVLSQAFSGSVFFGESATVDLNGQSVSGALFDGLDISGSDSGTNALHVHYSNCTMLGNSLGNHIFTACIIEGTIVSTQANGLRWIRCASGIAGIGAPSFDFGAVMGDTQFSVRDYSGGLELLNMGQAGTDVMTREGDGQMIINANCIGGTLAIRGNIELTDNSGGAVTLSQEARVTTETIWEKVISTVQTVGTVAEAVRQLKLLAGLDTGNPMTVNQTQRIAGEVTLDITGDNTSRTVTKA